MVATGLDIQAQNRPLGEQAKTGTAGPPKKAKNVKKKNVKTRGTAKRTSQQWANTAKESQRGENAPKKSENRLRHVCIYIYAVELLTGPSLFF